jgi:glycosyltransferase involved in cell wall biosynthesis
LKKKERFIISYIGTFGLAHKLEVVLRAAELLKNYPAIHFLLVGDGADRHHLEEFVSIHQIENVTILPLQPKINIPYFLEISDVGLIMLKNNELFKTVLPSKMFEYMGMHKPLLLSAPLGEASQIINKYNCGIHIQADQPRILAQKCLYYFENREIANKMGENGYLAVRHEFDRNVLSNKMLDVILSLL